MGYLWNTTSRERVGKPLAHAGRVRFSVFSPNGATLLTVCEGVRKIFRWSALDGTPIEPPIESVATVQGIEFHPLGHFFAVLSNTSLSFHDTTDGHPLGELLPVAGFPKKLQFVQGGDEVITLCYSRGNALVERWDAARRVRLGEPLTIPGGYLLSGKEAAISSDGQRLVLPVQDQSLHIWDLPQHTHIAGPRSQGKVLSTAISPDGRTILMGDDTGVAQLVDRETGLVLGDRLIHKGALLHGFFTPNNQVAITISRDRTVRQWDARTGKPVGAPYFHPEESTQATLSSDGASILTGSKDGVARVWSRSNPIVGTPSAIRSQLEKLTGQELTTAGVIRPVNGTIPNP